MQNSIQEIEKLYLEFLNKYLELIKEFGFKNPIEIYALYQCMLHKGYLSCNSKFSYNNQNIFDYNLRNLDFIRLGNHFYKLLSNQIFCGEGVCRHINSLLTDILNATGIKSNNLVVSIGTKLTIIDFNKSQSSYEEIYKQAIKFLSEEEAHDYAKNHENCNGKVTFKGIKYDVKYSGHQLTTALYNKNSYILDATIFKLRIFEKDCSSRNILIASDGTEVKYYPFRTQMIYGGHHKILSSPTLTIEESLNIAHNAIDICRENRDVMEQFAKDNYELYQGIDNQMKRVRQFIGK